MLFHKSEHAAEELFLELTCVVALRIPGSRDHCIMKCFAIMKTEPIFYHFQNDGLIHLGCEGMLKIQVTLPMLSLILGYY